MRNTWLVIRREYVERVRTKAFLISTLLVPALMAGVVLLPARLPTMRTGGTRKLAVVVSDARFGESLRRQLERPAESGRRYVLTLESDASEAERQRLRARVGSKELDGFLWAENAERGAKATYAGRETSDFLELATLNRALTYAAMEYRLAERGVAGVAAQDILKPVEMDTVQLQAGRESQFSTGTVFFMALMMVIFLYTTLLMYGVMVLRSVLEEKNTRIVEVLLASVSARELMAGKILGVGAVGLTQVLIWALMGAVVSVPSAFAIRGMGGGGRIPPHLLIYFPIFFLLGYLLYSATFAALGAAVNSEQEAQQFQIIIMLPIIFCMVMLRYVLRQPNAPLSVACSLVPFFAPLLMYLRIVIQTPPAWQIALCIGLMLATIWGMVSLCARIYRVGILMYGKRPTLPEIMKWLKYA